MDSPISKSSYLAARLAAGAVCHAIDRVLRQETKYVPFDEWLCASA